MSFLDPIPKKISDAFTKHFRAGLVHVAVLTSDDEGGFTAAYPTGAPVKLLLVDYTLDYRTRNGIPEDNVGFIVLRYGLAFKLDLDSQIEYTPTGKRYMVVGPVTTDPADAIWTVQARPI